MKPTVLIYVFTFISLLVLAEAKAQSSSSSSRLNIGKKNPTTFVGSVKRPLLINVKSGLDRNIKLPTSTAISAYYRNLGLAGTSSTAPKSRPSGLNTSVSSPSPELRNNTEDVARLEDLFFVNEKIRVMNVFPNPASDYAQIDYQLSASPSEAKIVLYNTLYVSVGEYNLDRSDRQLRLPTREIPTGVYFYQLLLDGKKVATKKLLVRH